MDTIFSVSRITLPTRPDTLLVDKNHPTPSSSRILVTNAPCKVEDIDSPLDQSLFIYKKNIMLSQPGFELGRCIRNVSLLSEEFISAFRYLFRNLREMSDFLPMEVDARCHLMAYNLFLWEVAIMVEPAMVKIDLFDMLSKRSGIFGCYLSPCGLICRQRVSPAAAKNHRPLQNTLFAKIWWH